MTLASRAVLVVEDEPQLRRVLRTLLELENFRVFEADSAARALVEARSHKPDLLIVDLGLPDRDGTEVITGVRGWSRVPIIVLSARSDEADKVGALEAGADDYITKPFGARELIARVQVALRHTASAGAAGAVLQIGAWRIDLTARSARDDTGAELHLTPTEFRLLEVLAQHIGLVVTHRTLLQQVWGPGSAQQTHYLRVYMKQLRAKLEPDPARPRWLLTETGVGYRLAQRELS
jgi:two-component system, OmpR family, KDP operon response regulator KdpE